MDKGAAVALTAAVGCAVALQAPINSALGKHVGTLQGALVNFVVGGVALTALIAVSGGFGGYSSLRDAAPWMLVGGFLGAAYVASVLVTVRSLGAGGVTAATIAGQLTMSLVIDQLGILNVDKSPITALKLLGVVLLAAGTFLIVRE